MATMNTVGTHTCAAIRSDFVCSSPHTWNAGEGEYPGQQGSGVCRSGLVLSPIRIRLAIAVCLRYLQLRGRLLRVDHPCWYRYSCVLPPYP